MGERLSIVFTEEVESPGEAALPGEALRIVGADVLDGLSVQRDARVQVERPALDDRQVVSRRPALVSRHRARQHAVDKLTDATVLTDHQAFPRLQEAPSRDILCPGRRRESTRHPRQFGCRVGCATCAGSQWRHPRGWQRPSRPGRIVARAR